MSVGDGEAFDAACRASVPPLAESVAKAVSGAGIGALALVGPTVGEDATLLVDACRDELVVGLERLGDVSVCEVHDPDPFERCGAGVPAAEIRFLAEVGVPYRVGALSSAGFRGRGYLRSGGVGSMPKVGRWRLRERAGSAPRGPLVRVASDERPAAGGTSRGLLGATSCGGGGRLKPSAPALISRLDRTCHEL